MKAGRLHMPGWLRRKGEELAPVYRAPMRYGDQGLIENILEKSEQWIEEKTNTKKETPKYAYIIGVVLLLMASILGYVWSHIHLTELKYLIAKEMSQKEIILQENEKLKMEIATLKSPQRIESIAREKLGMYYPEREQVIILK